MLSRRQALAGTVAAGAVAMAPSLADTEAASRLGPNDRRLLKLERRRRPLFERCEDSRTDDDEADRLTALMVPLEREMVETPADGIDGLGVKARVYRDLFPVPAAGDDEETSHVASIIADVVRLAGR